jgi:hypothetical protein
LCLSLISGLLHVSDMPLENSTTQTSVAVTADTHNACHEVQDSSHHSNI